MAAPQQLGRRDAQQASREVHPLLIRMEPVRIVLATSSWTSVERPAQHPPKVGFARRTSLYPPYGLYHIRVGGGIGVTRGDV